MRTRESTGKSVTLWTSSIRYKSLAPVGACIWLLGLVFRRILSLKFSVGGKGVRMSWPFLRQRDPNCRKTGFPESEAPIPNEP
jgi:hypothetical protein